MGLDCRVSPDISTDIQVTVNYHLIDSFAVMKNYSYEHLYARLIKSDGSSSQPKFQQFSKGDHGIRVQSNWGICGIFQEIFDRPLKIALKIYIEAKVCPA